MVTARYPKATWKGDGQSGGSYTSGPWKVVLHTTETEGLPSYADGASAPHMTYLPASRKFVQHTSFLTAARALRNESGGVQTNRDSAIQLEIVCYSAKSIADSKASRLWVGDLSAENLADIREFLEWTYKEFGVQRVWPNKQAFSYAQAAAAGFRMSGAEWDKFNGVCAHQHLPENTHWDTGALNWAEIMKEEDELTPAQEKALNALVTMLESRAPDAPPWGAAAWKEYLEFPWSGPTTSDPGPLNPVTHIQLAKVTHALLAEIEKVENEGGTVDAVARHEAARANARLDNV